MFFRHSAISDGNDFMVCASVTIASKDARTVAHECIVAKDSKWNWTILANRLLHGHFEAVCTSEDLRIFERRHVELITVEVAEVAVAVATLRRAWRCTRVRIKVIFGVSVTKVWRATIDATGDTAAFPEHIVSDAGQSSLTAIVTCARCSIAPA
jgi:hypothetical protein